MTFLRFLKWVSTAVAATLLCAALLIALFGWNWLRGPIERYATAKTGRALTIQGDLKLMWGWHSSPGWPHVSAQQVSFANPIWARQPQMLTADTIEVTLDVAQIFSGRVAFPRVQLQRPVLSLEQGPDGRKSWLLDLLQQDQNAMIKVGLVTLDQGRVGYDDVAHKTQIHADLATTTAGVGGMTFNATGQYNGVPLKASGNGGPVLVVWNDVLPYPVKVDALLGRTRVQAEGTVTSLVKFAAVDMHLVLSGDSLDQLYPLTGIAAPATRAYALDGRLLRNGNIWTYERFAGHFGDSDMAGSIKVTITDKRPILTANLTSRMLDIADLGPVIGAKEGIVSTDKGRVLPDIPFNAERWGSVNAEVSLDAKALRRSKALPLENFVAHLSLMDSVMTLNPLDFGVAGGHLNATIVLDGNKSPIQTRALVRARKIQLAKLIPAWSASKTGVGQINGEFDLAGQGNSVGRMLARANGKLGLTVAGGEISQLMMEQVGLHLWEMLALKVSGDRPIELRCAVADFDVKDGVLISDALVFDTEVTTVMGSGTVDFKQELLDLTLNPRTKNTSPVSLRSPIYVRGSFAKPVVSVDKGRVALRALGAIALGVVNPVLAFIPLIDPGPGEDSNCRQLVRDARAIPRAIPRSTSGLQSEKKRPTQ
jgi:uncharacterized protein involved in outer membrane biogenesis